MTRFYKIRGNQIKFVCIYLGGLYYVAKFMENIVQTVRQIQEISHDTVFVWKEFGSGEAIGMVSMRSCQKLSPCPTESLPPSSKMDPPLVKAKPISNGRSVWTTCLRVKKLLQNSSWRDE